MKDALWNIVDDADRRAKFATRRDRALATIVLSVEPSSLLYRVGTPEDQIIVWQKLANQFEKRHGPTNWIYSADCTPCN